MTRLLLWHDVGHGAFWNMACDEYLLQQSLPFSILRFYEWDENAVSFGYFDRLQTVENAFQGQDISTFVRRWTGGGIVDHRRDLTYSLIIPKQERLASQRGADSYAFIHQRLSESLKLNGVESFLKKEENLTQEALCFQKAVPHDLVDASGQKLSGAGQRRTRHGLLHQGSLQIPVELDASWKWDFARKMAEDVEELAEDWLDADAEQSIQRLAEQRYEQVDWLQRR